MAGTNQESRVYFVLSLRLCPAQWPEQQRDHISRVGPEDGVNVPHLGRSCVL